MKISRYTVIIFLTQCATSAWKKLKSDNTSTVCIWKGKSTCTLYKTHYSSETMNKVCSNHWAGGFGSTAKNWGDEAQLFQNWRCGFSQSPHAQKASILLVFYTV